MDNKQLICPVCGTPRQDPNSFFCVKCGCAGAYFTLFSGEKAYNLWNSAIEQHKHKFAARLYADSRDKGSSLHVTGDRICFHNAATHETITARFTDTRATAQSNVNQISLCGLYRVWINADGTLSSSGDDEAGQRKLSDLTGAVAVATAPNCTYVVHKDGTVTDRGNRPFASQVERWRDIKSVAANQFHVVGVKNNGTVVHAEAHNSSIRTFASVMDGWSGVKSVAVGEHYVLALHENGTVSYAGAQDERSAAANWTNIAAVAADSQYAIGLTWDGDVLLAGKESVFIDFGRKEAKQWKNVVFIAAGRSVIAGLTANGELKIVGNMFKEDGFEETFSRAIHDNLMGK